VVFKLRDHLLHPFECRHHGYWLVDFSSGDGSVWLCLRRALDETIDNEKLREIIWPPVERLALHMQNRE